jgi:hypothetical protein
MIGTITATMKQGPAAIRRIGLTVTGEAAAIGAAADGAVAVIGGAVAAAIGAIDQTQFWTRVRV